MSKIEFTFQSIKVALGLVVAFLLFGYTHQIKAPVFGSALYTPTYSNYTDSALATTTLAAWAGTLHTISVTTPVASSVITVCDSAATTTCAVVVAKITIPSTAPAPFTLHFDGQFVNGLTVVQATATSTLTADYQQN